MLIGMALTALIFYPSVWRSTYLSAKVCNLLNNIRKKTQKELSDKAFYDFYVRINYAFCRFYENKTRHKYFS